MIQFYFLSIFCNAAAGYALLAGDNATESGPRPFALSIHNAVCRFLLGMLSVVTGGFKLLSAVEGNVPVVGDLLPAITGLGMGGILLYEYHLKNAAPASDELFEALLNKHRRRLGMGACLVAALHFIFPYALFL
ncbi:MAG: hypothetical protein LBS86_07210 [Treponema sp.]|jgi:hypothetical protein|nr:hypothetical protein [Treponema sp.]